ncbi:MAG: hypothetical protein QQN41_03935 [Nitrosopumilus sp.]
MKLENNRCGIFIDIEGTSTIYKNNEIGFYQSLDCLLSSAIKISCVQFPEHNNRLLIHQMGADGVFIISDYSYDSYEIPISISIYLMQKLLICGSVGKCGISIGTNADIQSCMPLTREQIEISQLNPDGGGLMTKINVMGTALINSYRIASGKPQGSRIAIDKFLEPYFPSNIKFYKQTENLFVIDWIHTETEVSNFIYHGLNEEKPTINQLEESLTSYINENSEDLGQCWISNTFLLNGFLKGEAV